MNFYRFVSHISHSFMDRLLLKYFPNTVGIIILVNLQKIIIQHTNSGCHFFLSPNDIRASRHSLDCHLSTSSLHSASFACCNCALFCNLTELRAALIPSTGNLAIRSTFRFTSLWKLKSGNTSVIRPRN